MKFFRGGSMFRNILWLQWVAGMGAMIMKFTLGLMIGWTSPYLAKMTAEDSPLPLTSDEASWVASLFNLGRFVGAIIGGFTVHYFGSKRTLILLGFPLLLSWICIAVADSVIWLYIARPIAGVSLGMSFSSFAVFLGEVSSPAIRGTLVTLATNGLAIGTVAGNILGPYISMSVFAYISLVVNVVFLLLFFWIPESPHYLVRTDRIEDAEKSLARYNPNVDAKSEIESLRNFISTADTLTIKDRLREFNKPQNRRAGIMVLMLFFFMQFSGLNSLVFYAEIVLTAAKVNVVPPATIVMISGGVSIISGWITVYTADKFGRKVLMIFSSMGLGVSMFAIGVHFTLLDNGFDPNDFQWLPITAFLLFTIFVCNGIVTIPNIMVSELFAPNIKNLAACATSVAVGLFSFTAAKSFQPLVDVVGEAYVFFGHTVLMILCIIFTIIFMPETRGKTLQEIQDTLMRK